MIGSPKPKGEAVPELNSVPTLECRWTPAVSLPTSSDVAPVNRSGRTVPRRHRQAPTGVPYELTWRQDPDQARDGAAERILVSRWKDESLDVRRHECPADLDYSIVEIAVRATDAEFLVDGRRVHDGKVAAGAALMAPANSRATVEFRGPCDMLHLFVPRARLDTISSEMRGENARGPAEPASRIVEDPLVERLGWLLINARDYELGTCGLYMDAIALAIVSRLLAANGEGQSPPSSRQGLVKWRLKRVQALIEQQLSETLSLGDLASCAGLSRMHFAAQFRAATGMRPHEYLVRERIRRAQEILLSTTMPLVEVALSVGFQTQAHFTTVFRKLLGETPGRWRQLQRFE
jgi:AraC family transcriptional regulator